MKYPVFNEADDNHKIEGIKVELIEIIPLTKIVERCGIQMTGNLSQQLAQYFGADQNAINTITNHILDNTYNLQIVRARTYTDRNGEYEFKEYIPGNYVVRFFYGDRAIYSKNQSDIMNGGIYNYPYNGEFYQSAKANPIANVPQGALNSVGESILGSLDSQDWEQFNTNFWSQLKGNLQSNKSTLNPRFWYTVEGARYSDAYDETNRRIEINEKFKNGYIYSDAIDTIKNPTEYMMYAYTPMMELYPEKAITCIDNANNVASQEPTYTVNNIDFALTPRTKTQLNITKEVSNIRLVLQNGTVKFSASPEVIREQGVPSVVQAKRGSMINISMANELLNGATIEITYKITVKNDSEYDSITKYKQGNNVIAIGMYEENYNQLITSEMSNIEFGENEIIPVQQTRTYETGTIFKDSTASTIEVYGGKTSYMNKNSESREITTTRPEIVADFVANNLSFTNVSVIGEVINDGWDVYSGDKKEFINQYYKQTNIQKADIFNINTNAIQDIEDYKTEVNEANQIIISNEKNALTTTNLKSGESSSEYITLSRIISTESNLTSTKSYSNTVRVIKVNNKVSRIQDMNSKKEELRLKDTSEKIVISDPTGENRGYLVTIVILISTLILAGGVILIKKFVLK